MAPPPRGGCSDALAVLPWEKSFSRKGAKTQRKTLDSSLRLCAFAGIHFEIVDAVVVGRGTVRSGVIGTFSIVKSTKSSTTALRSFVSL